MRRVVRQNVEYDNHNGNHQPQEAGILGGAVILLPRQLEGGRRGVGVGERGADEREIYHDPYDSFAEGEHNQREDGDGDDGVARRTVGVPPSKPRRQGVVVRHGRKKAACGNGVADEVGKDSGYESHGYDNAPWPPKAAPNGAEGNVVPIGRGDAGDGLRPV